MGWPRRYLSVLLEPLRTFFRKTALAKFGISVLFSLGLAMVYGNDFYPSLHSAGAFSRMVDRGMARIRFSEAKAAKKAEGIQKGDKAD